MSLFQISNLPMIILPIFLMRLYKEYSFVVPKSRFANIVWVLLMFTGRVCVHCRCFVVDNLLIFVGMLN